MSSRLRVLLVEDREDDALLILRELKRGGYDVEHVRVETAAAMRKELNTGGWDVIISDYSMPQFTALDALAELKRSERDLPFIIVSGTVGEDVAVAALKGGAHDFIPKYNLQRFLPALERELREAEVRRRREEAEAELRTSTEMLAAVFHAAPLPMLLLEPSGNVLRWNPAAEDVFGWRADEVIGRRAPFVEKEHAEDYYGRLARVRSGRLITGEEITRVRKNGSAIVLSVSAAPIFDRNGDVLSILEVLLDVTEQRALETQFRQAQKMEAVGRLAGGIAHDFNNVLTVIEGYASLALAEIDEKEPVRSDIEEIVRAADRAAAFTRQLLAFSRNQVVQATVVPLNSLIRDLSKMLKPAIGDDIVLRLDLCDDPRYVLADRSQLEQVVMNLVVNARDAIPGHGTITVRTSRIVLDPDADEFRIEGASGNYTLLTVSDTGAGISPETMPHIFEPFYTTKELGKGTGLGLSTVYGIITKMGGIIRVSSEPHSGTTFSLYLPESPPPSEEGGQPAEESAEIAPAKKRNPVILVVEDEPAIQKVIARALERAGYQVLLSGDAYGALSVLRERKDIDLLISDVMLPNMRGHDLARAASEHKTDLKIMLMSGYSEDDVNVDRRFPYLEKPFSPELLVQRVAETMGTGV